MVQRIEVITGKERRQRWSKNEKSRLVAETLEPGAIVAHVARRHGVAESCLYTWRRQLAGELGGSGALGEPPPLLIPVGLDTPPPQPSASSIPPSLPPRALIMFADGTRLEIGADYPASALKALIAAVKGR